jgi:hypothetical protein
MPQSYKPRPHRNAEQAITVDGKAANPLYPDDTPSVQSEVKEIDDTTCNFPSCDKPKWTPYCFCGNTHAMMAGAKPIDDNHKTKGIVQTHTWDSMTKTCTPIIYTQPVTGSDDEEEVEKGDEEGKGTSDDEPQNETLTEVNI